MLFLLIALLAMGEDSYLKERKSTGQKWPSRLDNAYSRICIRIVIGAYSSRWTNALTSGRSLGRALIL
jgi:hypothetical protein